MSKGIFSKEYLDLAEEHSLFATTKIHAAFLHKTQSLSDERIITK